MRKLHLLMLLVMFMGMGCNSCGAGSDAKKTTTIDERTQEQGVPCEEGQEKPCSCEEGLPEGTQACGLDGISWEECECMKKGAVEGEKEDELLKGKSPGYIVDSDTGTWWQHPVASSYMYWNEARQYCEDLELAGHNDWSLPSIVDYMDLLGNCTENIINEDWLFCDPCTDKSKCVQLFGADHDLYWTQVHNEHGQDFYWRARLLNGAIFNSPKESAFFARCIRRKN